MVAKADGDFVPTLQGKSPERFAAISMQRMLTHCAARIVLKQMEGLAPQTGVGQMPGGAVDASKEARDGKGEGAKNDEERVVQNMVSQYDVLSAMLTDVPMGADPDEWMRELFKRDQLLALRVHEARVGYCEDGFEWENLRRVALEGLTASGEGLLRERAAAIFTNAGDGDGDATSSGAGPD